MIHMGEKQMFKYQVIADNSGKWAGNAMTYDTIEEAIDGAKDLMSRWMLVTDWRIVTVNDETEICTRSNYREVIK